MATGDAIRRAVRREQLRNEGAPAVAPVSSQVDTKTSAPDTLLSQFRGPAAAYFAQQAPPDPNAGKWWKPLQPERFEPNYSAETYTPLAQFRSPAVQGFQEVQHQQQLATQADDAWMADVDKIVQQRDAGEIDDWKEMATRLIQLKDADPRNEEISNLVNFTAAQYEEDLMPHLRQLAGDEWIELNIEGPPDESWWQKGLGLATPALEWLDSAWQGMAAAAVSEPGLDSLKEVGRGLANFATFDTIDSLDVPDEIIERYDTDGDGRLDFGEALKGGTGQDLDFGDFFGSGVLEGVAGFAGEVLMDPTTYLAGAGLVKNATKNVLEEAAQEGSEQVARAAMARMAKSGTKVWSAQERAFVERMLLQPELRKAQRRMSQLATGSKAWKKQQSLIEKATKRIDALRKVEQQAAEKAFEETTKRAAKGLSRFDRAGQTGVRFAGKTIPGTPKISQLLGIGKGTSWSPTTKVIEDLADVVEVSDDMLLDPKVVRSASGRAVIDQFDELPSGLADAAGELPPGRPGALPPGTGPAALPRASTPILPEDVVAVLKEVDDYLMRLSDNQRKAVEDIIEQWDPTTEVLHLTGYRGVDATFSAGDHAMRRAEGVFRETGGLGGRVSDDAVFRGTASGIEAPGRDYLGRMTGETVDDAGRAFPMGPAGRGFSGSAVERYRGVVDQAAPGGALGKAGRRRIRDVIDDSVENVDLTRSAMDTKEVWDGFFTLDAAARGRLSELASKFGLTDQLARRLVPRWSLAGKIDSYTNEAIRGAQVRAQKGAARKIEEFLKRLGGSVRPRAVAHLGGDEKAFDSLMNAAMANPQVRDAMLDSYKGTPVADAIKMIDDVRNEIWDTIPDNLKARLSKDEYIPRVLNDDAVKAIKEAAEKDPTLPGRLAKALGEPEELFTERLANYSEDMFLRQRTLAKDLQDLFDVNAEAAEILRKAGISDIDELFQTDLMAAWATRSESAMRAKIKFDLGEGLGKLSALDGQKLVVWHDDATGLMPQKGYIREERFGRPAWIKKELKEEMDNFFEVLENPEDLTGFFRGVNDMWARMALLSPGFHTRNLFGNVFNMFLGGMRNPYKFIDAIKYKKLERRITKAMGETGDDFVTAARGLKIDDETIEVIRQARAENILMGGQYDDITDLIGEDITFKNLISPTTRTKLNISMMSRDFGKWLETNSRMALYLDQIDKGVSYANAASHVRKYLFDYDDLTRWEKKVRGSVARFYTFTRKNTALQLEMLAQYPGRTMRLVKAQEKLADQFAQLALNPGGDEDGGWMPPWAQASMMGWRGTEGLTAFDSPYTAAMKAVESAAAIGTMPIIAMGLDEEMPESLRNALFYGDMGDNFNRATAIFSGFAPALVEWGYAEATNTDPFTGAPLDRNRFNSRYRFMSMMNPAFNRAVRFAEDMGWDIPGGLQNQERIEQIYRDAESKRNNAIEKGVFDAELLPTGDEAVQEFFQRGEIKDRSAMWLNWIGGMSYYPGEKARRQSEYLLSESLFDMWEDEGGYDLPSLDELREMGKLPIVNAGLMAIAYSDPSEWSEEIRDFLGKEVAEELMGPFTEEEEAESEAEELEKAKQRIKDKTAVVERMLNGGEPITAEQFRSIVLNSELALTSTEALELGLEPTRETNMFESPEDELEPTPEDNLARIMMAADLGGFTVDDLYGPRKREIDRAIEDAVELGYTWQDGVQWYLENEINRTQQGIIYGSDQLPQWTDSGLSSRDLQRETNAGWEFQGVIEYAYLLHEGRLPTIDELQVAMFRGLLGKTDQETLEEAGVVPSGWARGSIRSARNIQSEQEQGEDAYNEWQAALRGTQGPYVGRYDEEPEDNRFNFTVPGRQPSRFPPG